MGSMFEVVEMAVEAIVRRRKKSIGE
jgi:hypothetical protein